MPACEDSHQSSHTEADCAGSLFHSNKGTSAEHRRLVQTKPAWAQGEVRAAGEGSQGGLSQRGKGRGGLGNTNPHSRPCLEFHFWISCYPGFPCLPHQIPVAPLTGQGWEAGSSAILDSEVSPEEPEPHCFAFRDLNHPCLRLLNSEKDPFSLSGSSVIVERAWAPESHSHRCKSCYHFIVALIKYFPAKPQLLPLQTRQNSICLSELL